MQIGEGARMRFSIVTHTRVKMLSTWNQARRTFAFAACRYAELNGFANQLCQQMRRQKMRL